MTMSMETGNSMGTFCCGKYCYYSSLLLSCRVLVKRMHYFCQPLACLKPAQPFCQTYCCCPCNSAFVWLNGKPLSYFTHGSICDMTWEESKFLCTKQLCQFKTYSKFLNKEHSEILTEHPFCDRHSTNTYGDAKRNNTGSQFSRS